MVDLRATHLMSSKTVTVTAKSMNDALSIEPADIGFEITYCEVIDGH